MSTQQSARAFPPRARCCQGMLLSLVLAPLVLLPIAAVLRRRRVRALVARLEPGRMVIYTNLARSRRW